MANVLKFPEKTLNDWSAIELRMRAELPRIVKTPEVQEVLVSSMKEFWCHLHFNFQQTIDFEFPAKLSAEEVAALTAQISRKFSECSTSSFEKVRLQLFKERFFRELKFCQTVGPL